MEYIIERLEVLYDEALKNPSFASYKSSLIAKGKHRQREDLLSFIDSLQQEQQDQPEIDLEKEIDMFIDGFRFKARKKVANAKND